MIKCIFAILDPNSDHADVVYIYMKLKEWRVLNGHAVMFDTYVYSVFNFILFGF